MAEAFVREFVLDGKVITSVVMDEAEFNAFCDELGGIFNQAQGERANADQISMIKQAKHLPAMARGTKTEKFFTRYGIKSNMASFIVRGEGFTVAERYGYLNDE